MVHNPYEFMMRSEKYSVESHTHTTIVWVHQHSCAAALRGRWALKQPSRGIVCGGVPQD